MSFARPATVEDLLNFRLSRLLESSGSMVTRLCEGRYGITRREWRLICILAAQGPMSPSQLAERAHLERARISRHVGDLVAKKLVDRVGLAGDKRRASVALNARGRQLHGELFPQSVHFHKLVLEVLAPAERAAFDLALSRLTQAADRISASQATGEKADRRHGGSRRVGAGAPTSLPDGWGCG
ncbi:MarR family winged helix-turn-helix transcriptional regulator [Caenimonas terrae]|uniref:MarR family winged helix-turn-helix transcriptional regulator n=1 Tax=Caenimonas terrae TaxID=696074 RepID=A0ABW0NHJ5_9BURK